jgi:hypothetical protein
MRRRRRGRDDEGGGEPYNERGEEEEGREMVLPNEGHTTTWTHPSRNREGFYIYLELSSPPPLPPLGGDRFVLFRSHPPSHLSGGSKLQPFAELMVQPIFVFKNSQELVIDL